RGVRIHHVGERVATNPGTRSDRGMGGLSGAAAARVGSDAGGPPSGGRSLYVLGHGADPCAGRLWMCLVRTPVELDGTDRIGPVDDLRICILRLSATGANTRVEK